jgi:hypothetical protein
MGVNKLSLKFIRRQGTNIGKDILDCVGGVNILVGEGNTGKTKWLESIDYILGDDPSPEQREEDDIFKIYDSITADLTIGEEDLTVERRWKEPGGLAKVYVNGEPLTLKQYCDTILEKIGIPLVHYPQGNPYGARKWPELGWRALMRHVYRREEFWTDIADKQPEIDQHACLVQFLGVAEKLFSADCGNLVSKNKRIWELQAQRDQFMSILDEISKELLGENELGVTLTPESLASTRQRLQRDQELLAYKRERLLGQIRADIDTPAAQDDEVLSDVNSISEHLVELESQYEAAGTTVKRAESRVEEIATLGQLLENEMAKLERTSEAGAVLADLRVTHCPACDRPVDKDFVTDGRCYVCHRQVDVINDAAATRRLDFEKEQVESEREEAKQLLKALEDDLLALRARQSEVREKIGELRATLKPVQQAAAAVLPPELFLLDVEFGRIQESLSSSQELRRSSRNGRALLKIFLLSNRSLSISNEEYMSRRRTWILNP